MTSFMLSCLVEQANIKLKSSKRFKSFGITIIARAISARFNLAINDTHVNNCFLACKSSSGVLRVDVEKK